MNGHRRSQLLRLLTEYDPVDVDEQRYRLEMLDLAASAHDPFDRYTYQPGHFTGSGFVVHPDGDRVLLIHHAKIGAWLQPGGHIDADDVDPIAAARREIQEETGVAGLVDIGGGIFDIDVHVFPQRGEQPEHRHYDVRFAFVSTDPTLDPNHEATDTRWVALDELAGLEVDRSVRRPIEKLLGTEF